MVGVIAGQVMLLQLLLAGIAATQMAATQMAVALPAFDIVICSSDNAGDNGSGKSGGHVHHSPCTVCVFASSAPLVPHVLTTLAIDAGAGALLAPLATQRVTDPHAHTAFSARGPPQTA